MDNNMKKRWISLYVENQVGVLSKISGLFSGKCYKTARMAQQYYSFCAVCGGERFDKRDNIPRKNSSEKKDVKMPFPVCALYGTMPFIVPK